MKDAVREVLRRALDRYNSESAVLIKQIGEAEQVLADLRAEHVQIEALVQALSEELKKQPE